MKTYLSTVYCILIGAATSDLWAQTEYRHETITVKKKGSRIARVEELIYDNSPVKNVQHNYYNSKKLISFLWQYDCGGDSLTITNLKEGKISGIWYFRSGKVQRTISMRGDTVTGTTAYYYNPEGKPDSVIYLESDNIGSTDYFKYDSAGREIEWELKMDTISYVTTSFYNADGKKTLLRRITKNNGRVVKTEELTISYRGRKKISISERGKTITTKRQGRTITRYRGENKWREVVYRNGKGDVIKKKRVFYSPVYKKKITNIRKFHVKYCPD